MRCHTDIAPLCRLINNSLSSFAVKESQLSSLTKETEKHFLIILSQISRKIRELDDDERSNEDIDSHNEKEACESDLLHDCLPNIVCFLVTFLNVDSEFICHSCSNVLVSISDFLANSGGKWDEYLHVLCACLEVSISNVVSSTSMDLIIPTAESNGDSSRFIQNVREKMVNANWNTIVGLVRTSRMILKHLKRGLDGELMETYMNAVNFCLTNIPWELLNGILDAQDSESKIGSSEDMVSNFSSPVSRFVFLGTLLQLLCAIVHQSHIEKDGISSEHPVFGTIVRLVPKILSWCFHKNEVSNWTSNSQYLRHKMLMLMTRLSFQVRELSMLVLWLQLLHKHFQDLLHQSISKSHSDYRGCLDGSPFLSCIADGQKFHGKYIYHLQRQAIYLFLKCSFGLINLGKEVGMRCSCATSNSCVTYKLQSGKECCSWKNGLLELSEWLSWHVPLDMSVDYELYLEKCSRFASSFLQLYMDEDDYLFEVLLQLSTLPFPVQKMDSEEINNAYKELKGDIIFHLSNIFNPVHLFHLLLAELHYDHSVLLDYLISKDVGIRCLQYILRCLRTVSNSWNLFLEFPLCGDETIWSCRKRKFSVGELGSNGEVELASDSGKRPRCLDKKSNTNVGCSLIDTRKRTFQNAKECLLSLKNSIENLHQKNLFPYNPSALLRSFTRFEELCHHQGSVYLHKTGELT